MARARLVALACILAGLVAACGGREGGGARGLDELPDSGSAVDAGTTDTGTPTEDADAPDNGTTGPTCDEVDCHALAMCDDSSGTAMCTCIAGYGGNGTTICEDVDECDLETDDCATNATCTNSEGGFTCDCDPGYTGDGKSCTDLDECGDPSLNDCHANADCTNTTGGFACACKSGYSGDGKACADVDECGAGTDDCPAGTTCSNTGGGFTCECAAGFELYQGVCTDKCVVAMTEGNCDALATCQIVANDAVCSCPSTHYDQNGDGSLCVMNADCATECTDPSSVCIVESPTSVRCECPPNRFVDVNGDGSVCEDVNECTAGTHGCSTNATCQNTVGGFTCQCQSGFTGDGFTCTNIDECTAGTHTCDPNADCTDTSPGFDCDCKPFYQGNGQSCTDINECSNGTHDCHANANCANQSPGWSCACKSGFTGNGTTTCDDDDECSNGTANCHANADCTNTQGSYSCDCKLGYVGNGTTVCNNLDECATNQDDCDPNATCTDLNPPARFSCACNFGYTGNGKICTFQFCDLNGTWALRGLITTSWEELRADVFPYPVILQADSFEATVWEKRKLTYDGSTLTTEIQMCGATYPDAKNPALNETYGSYIPFSLWDTLSFQTPFDISLSNAKPSDPFNVPSRGYLFGAQMANADGTGAWPGPGALTEDCSTPGHGYPCWSNDDDDSWAGGTQWSRPPSQYSTIYNQNYDYPPSAPQVIITRRVACSHIASRSVYSMSGSVTSCNEIAGSMGVSSLDQRLHSCRRAANNNNDVNCATNKDVVTGDTLPNCSASDAQGLDQSIEDVNESVDAATFVMVRVADGADCGDVRNAAF